MALVRHTTDRFAALIGATATVRDLDTSLVEKDYWAVEALRAVQGGFDVIVGEETMHVHHLQGRHKPVEGVRADRAVLGGHRPARARDRR